MEYQIIYTKAFKKSFKKLSIALQGEVLDILYRLACGEALEPKYKDHLLKGKLKGFRDCHIRPDLILIYEKDYPMLILTAIDIGNHGDLFK
ncbi:addiction module toxin RelE [Helicobacter sp. 12S02634-8]|uniref:type II toxin-antitoxin system YafQ family toxin n=1 Tax=Helicobacter sp. 12S02634-8 TaxID=1476199 RepID=UPI000BA63485|nr:type II toxin-antitoxin system YafQ family toxin [Helicobacter sp. 12S02634-8]PAF46224.1 addiction module toxin RelE [Helicobacter sp. 12S02634-8]